LNAKGVATSRARQALKVTTESIIIKLLPMNTSELKPGLKGSTEIVVGTRDTAPHVGSGRVKVLATPVMVNLMEEAALNAVEGLLPEGHQTVGTHLDVYHFAATPVGMRVRAQAELISVEGRTLTFRVSAEDEKEPIGNGTHERIIINLARFDQRTQDKAGRN
jgi:fluoroacetyl-CoA thioesterase